MSEPTEIASESRSGRGIGLRRLCPSARRDLALSILAENPNDQATATLDIDPIVYSIRELGGAMGLGQKGVTTFNLNSDLPASQILKFFDDYVAYLAILRNRPDLFGVAREDGRLDSRDYLSICWRNTIRLLDFLSRFSLFSRLQGAKLRLKVALLLFTLETKHPFRLFRQLRFLTNQRGAHKVKVDLADSIREIKFSKRTGQWTNYYSKDFKTLFSQDCPGRLSDKRALVIQDLLSAESRPGDRVLDIASNSGYFSVIAANAGLPVTAIDYDVGAIESLYTMLASLPQHKQITPLLGNILTLTPEEVASLRSEIVLALGITHHLWWGGQLTWAALSKLLSSITNRVLITEFKSGTKGRKSKVPLHIKENGENQISNEYYTKEAFIHQLNAHFSSVETIGSYSSVGSNAARQLIVCRKIG